MASAVIIMLVLTWGGNKFAWASPAILAMIGSAVCLGVAFVVHALRTSEPFLPIPLLSGSVVPFAMVAGGCCIGAMIGLTVHMPLYYEVVYGLSASEAGVALIPLVAVSVLGAWACWSRDDHDEALQARGNRWRIGFGLFRSRHGIRNAAAAVAAAGASLGNALLASARCSRSAWCRSRMRFPRNQVGTATGAMNFFRSLMASFTVAVFTAILLTVLGSHLSIGAEHHIEATPRHCG